MPDFAVNANGRSRVAKTIPTSCEKQGGQEVQAEGRRRRPDPAAPSGALFWRIAKIRLASSANDAARFHCRDQEGEAFRGGGRPQFAGKHHPAILWPSKAGREIGP
jgi:hypothetical protein